MTKFIFLLMNLCIVSTLFSCDKVGDSTNNGATRKSTDTKGNVLIVYFSRTGENYNVGYIDTGNTAVFAKYIQQYTNGTMFEIVPAEPYPDSYEKTKEISQQEISGNKRPAIKNPILDLDKYSIIFIGSPVWYGTPPMIMRTFYETYKDKLSNKVLVPFGTHEGSGVSSCTRLIKEYFPKTTVLETFGIQGNKVKNSEKSIEEWLNRIGILRKK
jgi:flavodoxin